jgi:hypothetical protein
MAAFALFFYLNAITNTTTVKPTTPQQDQLTALQIFLHAIGFVEELLSHHFDMALAPPDLPFQRDNQRSLTD